MTFSSGYELSRLRSTYAFFTLIPSYSRYLPWNFEELLKWLIRKNTFRDAYTSWIPIEVILYSSSHAYIDWTKNRQNSTTISCIKRQASFALCFQHFVKRWVKIYGVAAMQLTVNMDARDSSYRSGLLVSPPRWCSAIRYTTDKVAATTCHDETKFKSLVMHADHAPQTRASFEESSCYLARGYLLSQVCVWSAEHLCFRR